MPTVTASTMIAQVAGCGQGWMSQWFVGILESVVIRMVAVLSLWQRTRKDGQPADGARKEAGNGQADRSVSSVGEEIIRKLMRCSLSSYRVSHCQVLPLS